MIVAALLSIEGMLLLLE